MSDNNIENSTVLIELDALFDTRISVLAKMGDDTLAAAIKENYHNRLIDFFKDIDNDLFRQLYDHRDKAILKDTIVTPMIVMLKEYCEKTLEQLISSPFHYKPKIMLNIFPYELLDEEIEVLIIAIANMTNKLADIQVVNMSYEDMTPMFFKEHISLVIMYEYYKWLEIHSEKGNFSKRACPEVTMFAPAIYFKSPDKKQIKPDTNPFKAMETLAAPFIGLKLLPIESFSMILKKT